MKEFNYLKERRRMLDSLGRISEICIGVECKKCPLSPHNNGVDMNCRKFEALHPDEATEIVRKWAEEHPAKTRKDVLLEKFPKAIVTDGTPGTCAYYLGLVDEEFYREYGCDAMNCVKCWNMEVIE